MPEINATQSAIDFIIYSLTVAAGLSLVIERILEVFKHFTDFESKRGGEGSRAKRATQSLKEAFDSAQQLKKAILAYRTHNQLDDFVKAIKPATEPAIPQRAVAEIDVKDDDSFEKNALIKVIPVTERNLTQIKQRAFLQLAAAALGIAAAEAFDIRLLGLFFESFQQSHLIDTIATGLVIGGGSQPIHILLRFLTTRRVPATEEKVETPAEEIETTIKPKATTHWIPFVYRGGVDKEKLQNRNLRPGNPNMIVYHHTAMHHENSFQAVVDEITKIKKWSTGYHCVIMPNGKVEFFCRWDRVGNHAYGANQESLGIAFHGNFHTLGNDKFSNHLGQFGNQEPTPEQIEAGAKVIALWSMLYQIPLDFDNRIVPHYLVKPTACPGSNFPHQKLQARIAAIHQAWQEPAAQQEITLFKNLPYVYV